MVYKKLESIEKEVKSLRKNLKTDKKTSIKGLLKGLKFKEIPFIYKYRTLGKSKSRKMTQLAVIYGMRALKLRLFGRT